MTGALQKRCQPKLSFSLWFVEAHVAMSLFIGFGLGGRHPIPRVFSRRLNRESRSLRGQRTLISIGVKRF